MTPVATPHSCGYRTAMPGDEDEATGPACGKPAEWRHCVLLVPVCTEHRCRCRTPIETSRSPVGGAAVLHQQYEATLRENLRLRAALREALDELAYALEYKPASLVKRHCDNEMVARLQGELLGRPGVELHPAEPPTDGRTSSGEEREP